MGIYRLLLAALVAISHISIEVYGFNPGVVAVISFFLISGYVTAALIKKYYFSPSAVPYFYLDRAIRIFPQFLFYTLLAVFCVYVLRLETRYLNEISWWQLVLNFFIFPQGLFMIWGASVLLIPQSWSLGLESMFYLFIPWILLKLTPRQIYALAAASFTVFVLAYFTVIKTEYFGYYLLPGNLYIFLAGASFVNHDRESKMFRGVVFLSAAALMAFLFTPFMPHLYYVPYNKEVLAGLLIGLPAIEILRRFKFSKIDEFLGNLSYGIFLNHIIIIWLMNHYLGVEKFGIRSTLLFLFISGVLALFSYFFVERPALNWRHKIRYKIKRADGA